MKFKKIKKMKVKIVLYMFIPVILEVSNNIIKN